MIQTISTIEPPKSRVGEDSAQIAVAVLTMPEKSSVLFCWTFWKALTCGLRRNSVVVVKSMPVHHENFAVVIITIPSSLRSAALAAAKQTLTEMDLLPAATIAMDRAGDGWFMVHGIGRGGIKFGDYFLRPEYFDASIAAMQKWNDDKQVICQALLEEAERRAAAEGQNPEAP